MMREHQMIDLFRQNKFLEDLDLNKLQISLEKNDSLKNKIDEELE